MFDGVLNFLKPSGMTSNDAVGFVKRTLRQAGTPAEKVGHGGTLDPEAAGVLPILLGKATRLFDEISDKRKIYIGEIVFGESTDTQDAFGKVIGASAHIPQKQELLDILGRFTGEIKQVPPKYSALKINGVAAYELARRGKEFETCERDARVYGIDWLAQTADNIHVLRVECGRGTYIRTLFHDMGAALGTASHMGFLLRASCGEYIISRSRTMREVSEAAAGRVFRDLIYTVYYG